MEYFKMGNAVEGANLLHLSYRTKDYSNSVRFSGEKKENPFGFATVRAKKTT